MPILPHRAMRALSAQRGFSLIELIIAFALIAMVLTTALAIAARAYRQVTWSGSAQEAAQWAQSLADEADGRPLALGHSEGRVQAGRYRWTREVSEYIDPEGLLRGPDGKPTLWQTRLTLHWHDGQRENRLRLVGLRPAPAARQALSP